MVEFEEKIEVQIRLNCTLKQGDQIMRTMLRALDQDQLEKVGDAKIVVTKAAMEVSSDVFLEKDENE